MIDVDKPPTKYSLEKLQRFPHDMLLFKYNDDTIGTIQLKYGDELLWNKAIDYLNRLKIGSTS